MGKTKYSSKLLAPFQKPVPRTCLLGIIARSNPTSWKEAENPSSDECDKENFSAEDYEKYEYEIQAFMAGGREWQEMPGARAAQRREEEGVLVQPSASVRSSAERAAPPRQVKRKPILEAQWQKYVHENWTILIGMFAGKSWRKVYGQAMLALHDALGRRTRAQMAMEIVQVGGYLGPFCLKKELIDPKSTRTLVSEDFVNSYLIPMRTSSCIYIELANGQIEIPVGELIEPQKINIAEIVTTLNLPVVQSQRAYDILLGWNWLRAVGGSANYAEHTTYHIYGNGRAVTLWNTNEGCVPMRIQSDEAVPKLEHEDSRFPENDDWCEKSCCCLGVDMGAGLAGTGLVPVSQFRRGPVPVATGRLYPRYQ